MKIISVQEAVAMVQQGMTVMVGGFLGVGAPEEVIDALIARDVGDLTLIANDTAFPDKGVGKLVVSRQGARVIVSHIGTNKDSGQRMNEGDLAVELVPQGTLAEQIRAAGFGLGGVLTKIGMGTPIEQGKRIINVEGQDYMLFSPLKADIALIKAHRADMKGNLVYRLSARNFNPLMATAAETVIAQVDEIVETGGISPDEVVTPGIFVDYLVRGKEG